MKSIPGLGHPGILAALGADVLFGVGAPLAKWLLGNVDPWMLAGLFYLGSGVGFFAHGVNLALFVVGLRYLGTGRTDHGRWRLAPLDGASQAFSWPCSDTTQPLACSR